MRPRKRNLPPVGAERAETAAAEVAGGAAAEVAGGAGFSKPVTKGSAKETILGKLMGGSLKDGNFKAALTSWDSWRADARSKSVNPFSYNEADEELTRNCSSIDGGRQSED
jgi:hypothetical protein